MKVTFLGTGTSMGIPMIACDCAVCKSFDSRDVRTRSSVRIEVDGKVLVIDSGPDFRQQMLTSGTKNLDAILYTHEHKDHTGGLDDVRAFNWINKKPVSLFAEKRVLSTLKQEYSYAFREHPYPGVPDLVLHEIDEHPFDCSGVEIMPIRVYHHHMAVLGYRIGDFSYVTDASCIPLESMERLSGTRCLVINGLRIKAHFSHFNLEQALEIIDRLAPDKAYITHISHHLGFHRQVSKKLPENVFLAWDGLEVEV